MQEKIISLLRERGLKVAIAESLTGGAVAAALVSVAGASAVFDEGFVTYSNAAKINRLGVCTDTIANFGTVSSECAVEMAEGVAKVANADIGLATTGIAGPDGGTAQKPVGLVYIALHFKNDTTIRKLSLSGTRADIISQTIKHSLELLQSLLSCGKMD